MVKTNKIDRMWDLFQKRESLSDLQIEQFKQYMNLLQSWNKKMNLTAITDDAQIIADHFHDSLELGRALDLENSSLIADIGTGAGFPAIPLKIKYSHLSLLLIEVNQKKIKFLDEVITQLSLENVEVVDVDWRTFLRHTDYPVDIFCARASLQPKELVRLFKSGPYQQARLVYWASASWIPTSDVEPFIDKIVPYTVADKKRKLVFFKEK